VSCVALCGVPCAVAVCRVAGVACAGVAGLSAPAVWGHAGACPVHGQPPLWQRTLSAHLSLIGLVRKDASVWLEAVAAVAEEAAVAAMQAFRAEQPLPQQPVPVFPRYSSRGRSLEQMQESALRKLLDGGSAARGLANRSLEQRQAAAALCWASAVRLSDAAQRCAWMAPLWLWSSASCPGPYTHSTVTMAERTHIGLRG
jgi:hypothetical protein